MQVFFCELCKKCTYVCMYTIGIPSKKRKMERKGKAEKDRKCYVIIHKVPARSRGEVPFTFEEEQLKRENELRREEREHELRLFQMLGQMMRPPEQEHYTQHYPTSYYNFEN